VAFVVIAVRWELRQTDHQGIATLAGDVDVVRTSGTVHIAGRLPS
jgi:hypothetical protein